MQLEKKESYSRRWQTHRQKPGRCEDAWHSQKTQQSQGHPPLLLQLCATQLLGRPASQTEMGAAQVSTATCGPIGWTLGPMAGPKVNPLGRVLRNCAFVFICCLNCQRAAEQQQTLAEQSLRPWGSTILQLCLLTLQVGAPEDLG